MYPSGTIVRAAEKFKQKEKNFLRLCGSLWLLRGSLCKFICYTEFHRGIKEFHREKKLSAIIKYMDFTNRCSKALH